MKKIPFRNIMNINKNKNKNRKQMKMKIKNKKRIVLLMKMKMKIKNKKTPDMEAVNMVNRVTTPATAPYTPKSTCPRLRSTTREVNSPTAMSTNIRK